MSQKFVSVNGVKAMIKSVCTTFRVNPNARDMMLMELDKMHKVTYTSGAERKARKEKEAHDKLEALKLEKKAHECKKCKCEDKNVAEEEFDEGDIVGLIFGIMGL